MSDRIKLTITEVGTPEQLEGKQYKILKFKAKNPEGKEFPYACFKSGLFQYIKKDAEIDADVETRVREVDGNTFYDRSIKEIYVDDKPVGAKSTGQRSGYGKSPEMVMAELQAKARNTALMQACELAKSDKVGVKDILKQADDFFGWLQNTQVFKPPVIIEYDREKPAEKQIEKPQESESTVYSQFCQLCDQYKPTKEDLKTWILPEIDGRKYTWRNYFKEVLNEKQQEYIVKKIKEKVEAVPF